MKTSTIIIIVLCVVILLLGSGVLNPDGSLNTDVEYENLFETLEKEIGEVTTSEYFQEIKTKVESLDIKDRDTILNVVNEVSNTFGISLSDEQKDIIINHYLNFLEENNDFLTNIGNGLSNFWTWFKNLWGESKLEISPIEGENENVIETNDDSITINLPTVSDVDNMVNKILKKSQEIFYPETTSETE